MRNFINWYSSKKLISIPVTILVAALIVSGINLGVVNSNKKSEEVTLETNLASANNTYGYTGLVPNEYGWWYVNNGQVDFNYNGLVYDQNVGWWLVRGGAIDFGYNGLYCDANYGWWLIQGGTVNFGYNGLYCDANCGWWLIQGGTVGFGYNGLVANEYGWWYVNGGTIDFGYTGLVPNEYGWWYVQGGAINFNYTGLAYDPYVGWWYVNGGAIDFGYNGIAYNEYGAWYVNGGAVDFNASANLNASSNNNNTPNKPKKVIQTAHIWGNISKDHPVAQHQLAYDDYSLDSIEIIDVNCTYTVRYEEELVNREWDEDDDTIAEGFCCWDCGYYSTDYNDVLNHCEKRNHHKGINETKWTVAWNTIHHPAEYQKREYITYTCSECGQTYEVKGGLVGERYSK